MSGGGYIISEAALAEKRSRYSWNNWLDQAQRPASEHEETKIQRAATMASAIVTNNAILVAEGARIFPQGSYYNNTNVRREADMDLRVQLPAIFTHYMDQIPEAEGDLALGYTKTGSSFGSTLEVVRSNLLKDCIARFGASNVDGTGNKAITVSGLDGSRADCDLVPAFHLHAISRHPEGGYSRSIGVAIIGRDGRLTMNFPEEHHTNGIAKRANTSHRFKRYTRMLKRLNYELETVGDLQKRLPSFLVECLTYVVENEYFLVEADDHYLRLVRILNRLSDKLRDPSWCADATEVNEIKFLFRSGQSWTRDQAITFVASALRRLEV
jgi:hypothetical protein